MRCNRNRRMVTVWTGLAAAAIASLTAAQTARASFHLWEIDEVFSDASGNVQFIEFDNHFDFEYFLTASGGLTSNTHSYSFPGNLPAQSTVNKHFLVGTAAYAALAGVPAPDYVIPNGFFSTAGDTLTLQFADNGAISFTGAQLPTDGMHSLNRAYGGPTSSGFTTAINSPTNFAGETGIVPEPSSAALLLLGAAMAASDRRRRAASRSA